jgi:hypothetical protein
VTAAPPKSCAVRHARVSIRSFAGLPRPAKAENTLTSILYARRILGLVTLASYSSSGGTSARSSYCAGRQRPPGFCRARFNE